MNTCVIMHNMFIESERKSDSFDDPPYDHHGPLAAINHYLPVGSADFLAMRKSAT
jgi:hypothetical protein